MLPRFLRPLSPGVVTILASLLMKGDNRKALKSIGRCHQSCQMLRQGNTGHAAVCPAGLGHISATMGLASCTKGSLLPSPASNEVTFM